MKAVVLSWEGEAGEGRKHNCVFNGQECIALASTLRIFFFFEKSEIHQPTTSWVLKGNWLNNRQNGAWRWVQVYRK